MFAEKLRPGDEIRIIAPSTSMALVKGAQREIAEQRLMELGFKVSYGNNVQNHNEFFSSSIEERIEDLHNAFLDPNVKGILTVIGGYNSNQLIKYIDYETIKNHPKIFCGFGDITALNLAFYKKTGLINYSGPHFSTLGTRVGFEYTLSSFLQAVTNDAPYEINPSENWSDDSWHLEEEERTFIEQDSYLVLREGEATGKLIGGNLSTMNLLQGTEYMPSLKDAILFIEDDEESHMHSFDRDLQSLLHLPDAEEIKAILIGRFQRTSNITEEALRKIIDSKKELKNIPIIGNVNFGHVSPIATIPIGAMAQVTASSKGTEIIIVQEES